MCKGARFTTDVVWARIYKRLDRWLHESVWVVHMLAGVYRDTRESPLTSLFWTRTIKFTNRGQRL